MESTTLTSAATKVFDLPELLETIIGFVPERFILTRVQRVARRWKATVDASRLQKKLWLHKGKTSAVSPLYVTRREEIYQYYKDFGVPIYKMRTIPNSLIRNAHSLLQDCCMGSNMTYGQDNHGSVYAERDFFFEYCPSEQHVDSKPAFPDASKLSWHPMQICDPPITVAKLRANSGELAQSSEPAISRSPQI
jgi:hypothetical protein